ncbi:MAG TPA: sulfurtransferase, partial [Planctomycetota bacterium]|nr:sulfurtransferase [Planctomycetota bacterium]
MEQALNLVERFGGSVVFLVVFIDQLGLPIPSVPILLAFGALAGSGRIDPVVGLGAATLASL